MIGERRTAATLSTTSSAIVNGPSAPSGTVIWNAANNFGGGRFVVGAGGTTATIAPILIAAGDRSGTYQWTVTFVSGAQTVTRNFAVTYSPVVAPPPPPPAPTFTVGIIASSFSTTTVPYQPTIAVTGSGLSNVATVQFTWTAPNGQTGTVTWNAANNFGGGRFVVGSGGTSATISPVLVAANDPAGNYNWTVSFIGGNQNVTRNFVVTYTAPVAPPPPPPPVSLTASIGSSFTSQTAPYQPAIPVSGTGLNNVTEVRLSWTDPNGLTGNAVWNAGNNFGGGKFVVGTGGTSATIQPVLVATGDPSGAYQWTVTFVAGSQTVTRNFTVGYSPVVVPPPPPPPPPPVVLTSDLSGLAYDGATPWQPPLRLTGRELDTVTRITLSWIDPRGTPGSITFVKGDSLFASRFEPSADGNSATLTPKLLALYDPPGLYQWTLTLSNGGQSVTDRFNVTYSAPQLEEPLVHGPVQPPAQLVLEAPNASPQYVTTAPYLGGQTTVLLAKVTNSDIDPALRSLIIETIQKYGGISEFDHIADNVQYAMLANAVYGGNLSSSNNPSVQGWEDLNAEFSNMLFTISGFTASVYRDRSTGKVVIAFAGTDQWQDWGTNLALGAGQEGAALRLFNAVTQKYGPVTLTGHSLGGGLAQVIAALTGSKAVTFDPAPFTSPGTRLITGEADIVSFRNNNDPLTALFGWASSGKMTTVKNTAEYPTAYPELNHSMENLLTAMQAVALYNKTLKSNGLIQ